MAVARNVVPINFKAKKAKSVENFTLPQTIEEARTRIALLTSDKKNIDLQLTDRWNAYINGGGVDSQEYDTWKKKAFSAKCWKLSEIAFLETWIENNSVPTTADQIFELAKNLKADEVKILITLLLQIIK